MSGPTTGACMQSDDSLMAPGGSPILRFDSMSVWRSSVLLAIVLGGASCGDAGTPEPTAGESHNFAVLYATRQEFHGALPGEEFVDVGLGARVVRYEGIDRTTVAEVLEMTEFEADDVAPDECGEALTAATLEDVGGIETGASVELVDVGPLEVRSVETVKRLSARSFPDLLSLVAGVVYAGDDSGGLSLASGSEVSFFAPGGGAIGPLDASGTLPTALDLLRVGGQDPELGTVVLARGADLEVVWDGAGGGDEIRIELSWMQPAGTVVVTCRANDDGFFMVPAERTRLVPELAGVDARMTIRRLRRSAVSAIGLEEGDLVLQQAVTLPFRVQ